MSFTLHTDLRTTEKDARKTLSIHCRKLGSPRQEPQNMKALIVETIRTSFAMINVVMFGFLLLVAGLGFQGQLADTSIWENRMNGLICLSGASVPLVTLFALLSEAQRSHYLRYSAYATNGIVLAVGAVNLIVFLVAVERAYMTLPASFTLCGVAIVNLVAIMATGGTKGCQE